MTTTQIQNAAYKAVQRIIIDLADRRGLKHEWQNIDTNIQTEIHEQWVSFIIRSILEEGEK